MSAPVQQEVVIRVENLRTGFGDFIVHENVSFEIRRGEVFAILGGSGCGKTVLLKHMIGLRTSRRRRASAGWRSSGASA